MEFDLSYYYAVVFDQLVKFYNSNFFLAVKIIIGIYVFVLFVDIVLLLVVRGVGGNLREAIKGLDMPAISKSKAQKRWDAISARLKTANMSQYKVAIIEADSFADEILEGIGYKGKNMSERLEQVKPGQLDHLEQLKYAHGIRNRIVHEEDFVIDEVLAKDVLDIYEDFLKYLELF